MGLGGASSGPPSLNAQGGAFVGRDVVVRADESRTLLDEVLRAGHEIPYGCFTGTCGRCEVTVRSGCLEVDGAEVAAGGGPETTTALACRARVRAPSTLEVARIEPLDPRSSPPDEHRGVVVANAEIAAGIRRLVVAFEEPFGWIAGQYLRLHVPGDPVPRAYSIATAPSTGGRELEFHVRRVPGGKATEGYVFAGLSPGDETTWSGPYGHFRYVDDDRPAVFVAGGTGLAPLAAMIDEALASGSTRSLHLFHGARTAGELHDLEHWREKAAAAPGLEYVPVVAEGPWEGETGLVTDAVARRFDRLRGHVAYLCGPPAMVDAAVSLLLSLRVRGGDVHREEFF